ncbi:MAG TPA: transposase, partial [Actinocrinis sp.]|uniref:transposase n=1 Tax=Actinocrinis sp. TaxID=1920516 RepID=UPI002DDC9A03
LSLEPVHRRGHQMLYLALARARVDIVRLRRSLAGLSPPRSRDGRVRLALDVSGYPRPYAATSPERLHTQGSCSCDGQRHTKAGWPFSFLVALQAGPGSFTAVLDAARIAPADDVTEVSAVQIRQAVERLVTAGWWRCGDPPIVIAVDAGYDVARLAFLLAGLPVELVGRVRADRVFHRPAPARKPGRGRPARHGARFAFTDPATWGDPDQATCTQGTRYGTAGTQAWWRLHPRLGERSGWDGHEGELPLVEGTVIHLSVERLPGNRAPKPVWLWCSNPQADAQQVDQAWSAYLRRFDIEHMFRLFKQTLGWTRYHPLQPSQAETWTWLLIAAYTQLRLARGLVADRPRPWERAVRPDAPPTPARVRREFRRIQPDLPNPTSAQKKTTPGPGRPRGTIRPPRPRYTSGKNPGKPDTTPTAKTESEA